MLAQSFWHECDAGHFRRIRSGALSFPNVDAPSRRSEFPLLTRSAGSQSPTDRPLRCFIAGLSDEFLSDESDLFELIQEVPSR